MSEPDFDGVQARIHLAVAAQGFTQLLGARIRTLAPGECLLEIDSRPDLLQHYGFFHGGVAAYLIDNASAIAAATIAKTEARPITSEFKVNFLNPPKGTKLRCHARVLKAGRTLVIVAADVHAQTEDGETHAATALSTIFLN